MKKGDARTFVLLGIFLFIGLLFMLFANINPINSQMLGVADPKSKDMKETRTDEAAVDEPKTPEELSERMFSDKMSDFKALIVGLEQRDTQKFKTDTQKALNKLADIIGEFSSISGDKQSTINEKILSTRRSAEKLALLQDDEKIITELKNGLTSANEAIKGIKVNLNCEKREDRTLCEGIERKSTDIENKLTKIDKTNYKSKTKEIFADFHSILQYLHKKVSTPTNNMTMIQPENANDLSEQPYQVINKQESKKQYTKSHDNCDCDNHDDHDDNDKCDDRDKQQKGSNPSGCKIKDEKGINKDVK
ncbi:MAG: hypothetical protein GX568_05140 [Candidatus Gastranaerophilales bacterium]|nr:hypothetical protein [Candidatus Gastranaerophilales bacterium]